MGSESASSGSFYPSSSGRSPSFLRTYIQPNTTQPKRGDRAALPAVAMKPETVTRKLLIQWTHHTRPGRCEDGTVLRILMRRSRAEAACGKRAIFRVN